MTADVELLPCPFCGGTEICIGTMDLPIAGEYWTVGCNNDDCPLCTDSVMVEGGTLEKAAAVWNTRTTDASLAPLQAEIERLREEVAGLSQALTDALDDIDAVERLAADNNTRAERLRAEVERLRSLCAAAYQMAGVHDAPDEWLDALSNAASGRKFSIDGLLPYMPDAVCEAYARAERLAEALRDARARTADLAAWLKSGNAVPADLPFVFRERWQKIAADIQALEAALAQEGRA